MKVLHFTHRGEYYKVKENGDMIQENNTYNEWNGDWKLLGVSTHHWHNRIIHTTKDIFKNPSLMKKGYVWDCDHGTTRIWGGCYYGHLPRVTSAYIEELEA